MNKWQPPLLLATLGALAVLAAVFHQGYPGIFLFSVLVNGVLAVSYDIPGRSLGLISLGHAVFFGIGAYVFGVAVSKGSALVPALILSGILGSAGAVLISAPLAALGNGYYSLATLGVLYIFQNLGDSLETLTDGPAGLYIPQTFEKLHCNLLALGLLVLTVLLHELLSRSRWGYYSRETEADEEAARAVGIPTRRVKIIGLVAAAVPAALAGALHLARASHVSPASGFSLTLSITALLASRIVPVRGALGPLLGVLLITVAEEMIWTKFEGFNHALFGLILLAAALFQGIGRARRLDKTV